MRDKHITSTLSVLVNRGKWPMISDHKYDLQNIASMGVCMIKNKTHMKTKYPSYKWVISQKNMPMDS